MPRRFRQKKMLRFAITSFFFGGGEEGGGENIVYRMALFNEFNYVKSITCLKETIKSNWVFLKSYFR